MTFDDYLHVLRRESDQFARAIAGSDHAQTVPTCPEWTVRDLALHLGEVQRWARFTLEHPGAHPPEDYLGPLPDGDGVDAWLRDGAEDLARALQTADPAIAYFTFLTDVSSPLLFWARRQAHEVGMHRVDAESVGGKIADFGTDVAVDGIDELLTGFIPRPHVRLRSDTPRTMLIAPTDADARWSVTISQEPVRTIRSGTTADCVVTGTASDLYRALWNRPSDALSADGDHTLLSMFSESIRIRWS